MNEKGGMNAIELQKYMDVATFPLFPDISDMPVKCVLMKVDSGPGRMNIEMLASLKLKGMYLMPGVPNTTQVTQETDQSYGQYKSIYRRNLRVLSQARQPVNKPMVLTDLALLIFGGVDRITGMLIYNTFEKAFSKEKNLSCWKKCGVVPLTRYPLQLQCVRQEIERGPGVSENKAEMLLRDLERWNHYYCDFLSSNGYAGHQLKACAPVRRTISAITVPNSKARLKAIQMAKMAGQMFFATGGQHLNADDFFKAKALSQHQGQAALLEKEKLEHLDMFAVDQEAKSLLQAKGLDLNHANEKKFVLPECKLLCKWKGCKVHSSKNKVLDIDACLQKPTPPLPEPWTPEEEARLVALKGDEIDIKDAALGVAAKQMAAAVTNNMEKLNDATRHELLQSLAKCDSSCAEARGPDPDHTTAPL